MVLQKQIIAIPFGQMDMDTGSDPKVNTGIVQVINANYDVNGMIKKREGFQKIVKMSGDRFTNKLANYRNQPASWGGFDGYVYQPHLNEVFNNTVYPMACDISRSNTVENSSMDYGLYTDYADIDDYNMYVYTQAASSFSAVKLLDKDTEIARLDSLTGSNSSQTLGKMVAKAVRVSPNLISLYSIADFGTVRWNQIDTTTQALAAAGGADVSTGLTCDLKPLIDACWLDNYGGDGYVAIVYKKTTGRLGFATFKNGSSTPFASSEMNYEGYNSCKAVACWPSGEDRFIVAQVQYTNKNGGKSHLVMREQRIDCSNVSGIRHVLNLEKTSGAFLSLSGVMTSDKRGDLVYSWQSIYAKTPITVEAPWYITNNVLYCDTSWDLTICSRGQLATKPVAIGNDRYIVGIYVKSWLQSDSAQDQIVWIVAKYAYATLKIPYSIGRSLVGTARLDGYSRDSYGVLASLIQVGNDYKYATALPYVNRKAAIAQQVDAYGIARLTIDLEPKPVNTSNIQNVTYIPNSMPYTFGQQSTGKHDNDNWALYPEPFVTTYLAPFLSTTGGMTVGGVYKYKMCYEKISTGGLIERGTPMPSTLTVTMTGANSLRIIGTPYPFYPKGQDTVIALYRTVAGGTLFYRCMSFGNATSSSTSSYSYDYLSDADLVYNEPLYTDGGEIENVMPFPHRVATIWQNRYVYADRENESTTLYYSKEFVTGYAIGHSDLFSISVDEDGGEITGLFAFSNKLIIFKKNRIYATAGTGRDAIGGGNDFSIPWVISPSVGCINQKSMVRVPNGVMFQSERGIWLLTQNEELNPLGQPVQQYVYGREVTSTGVVENRHSAYFLFNDDSYALSYNWFRDKWSLITNQDAYDSITIDNTMYWLGPDYYLYKNLDGYFGDLDETGIANFYRLQVDTGWLALAGTYKFERIYRIFIIGQNLANHKLRVKVAYDYDPNYIDNDLYDATQLSSYDVSAYFTEGLGSSYNDQNYIIEVPTSRQKCVAIRLSISDEESHGCSEGFALSHVAFEFGIKPVARRASSNKIVGG